MNDAYASAFQPNTGPDSWHLEFGEEVAVSNLVTPTKIANLINNGDINKVRNIESKFSNADQAKIELMIKSDSLPDTLEKMIQERRAKVAEKDQPQPMLQNGIRENRR